MPVDSSSLAPGFLLAAPALGDPNFAQSVVLLGYHDAEGAFGWVLNGRPLMTARQLLEEASLVQPGVTLAGPCYEREARVGGPVKPGSAWLLFERPPGMPEYEDMHHLGGDYWITGSRDAIEDVGRGAGPENFRLLLGYAGWGPQQLESEIRVGAWLPTPFDGALLFATQAEGLWDEAYRRFVGAPPAAFTSGSRGSA